MTYTSEESALMDERDNLSQAERDLIDATIESIEDGAKQLGIPLAGDDRAYSFEAAIIRYILASRRQ